MAYMEVQVVVRFKNQLSDFAGGRSVDLGMNLYSSTTLQRPCDWLRNVTFPFASLFLILSFKPVHPAQRASDRQHGGSRV